jgi:hypothetical protein
MIRLRKIGQPIFFLMALLTFFISVPFQPAFAALIQTEAVISPERVEETRLLLNQLVAREDMRRALISYGINPAEAKARVASMTNSEICSIMDQVDKLRAGGDGMLGGNIAPFSTGVGIAIIAGIILVFALLIFLLVRLAPGPAETVKETKSFTPSGGNLVQSHPQVDKLQQTEPSQVKIDEPWTGKWNVQGSLYASGLWVLKQNGQMVVSTDASFYSIEGTVTENRLVGTYMRNPNYIFRVVISPDGQYFEGHATDKEGTRSIQGVRIK